MLDQTYLPASNGSRFERLFAAEQSKQPIWNTILAATPDYVVVPTLGSIVPFWHLVIPRVPSININEHLAARGSGDIHLLLEPIVTKHRAAQVLWFEHGPNRVGSPIGCGADYAHLHVVLDAPFSFGDFQLAAREDLTFWKERETGDAYRGIRSDAEYYAFGNLQTAYISEASGHPKSQLFRKIIARLTKKDTQWNYREHAHEDFVRRTVNLWGSR